MALDGHENTLMPSNGSQRNFHWSAADGRQLAIALGSAQITVTDGVAIKVGPGEQDGGKPTLDLDLLTVVVGRDDAGDLAKRFVVIPLDERSLLVAVAEPSEEPANLCPVVSTPAWVTPGGGSMPTSEGSLLMLGEDGTQLRMTLTPGPDGHANVCVVHISCATPSARGLGFGDQSTLLLLHVSPCRIRIGLAPSAI
jgi:hypothetical protein